MKGLVLVTGANGYLGTNLIGILLDAKYSVKAAIKEGHELRLEPHPNLQVMRGDLHDLNYLQAICQDVDYVVHAAARTCQINDNYTSYFDSNVVLTRNLLQFAIRLKVKRFIFISTANTIGHGSAEHPGDENSPMSRLFEKSWYARSKREAELEVLKRQAEISALILNPSFMIGGKETGTSSGKFMKQLKIRHLLFVPPGSKSYVSVEDVSRAIILAFEKGGSGNRFLLSSECISYSNLCEMHSKLKHKKQIIIVLPRVLLLILGALGQFLGVFGVKTSISINNMKILCEKVHYSNAKSREILGLKYKSIEETLSSD